MRFRFPLQILPLNPLIFRPFHLGIFFLVIALGCLGSIGFSSLPLFNPDPAIAQIVRTENVWRKVYEQVPDLPLENQYISKETGKVLDENTLAGRLIRYHVYVKGRPPFSRLDWKLTLADYLGVNGTLDEKEYPSATQLRKNPMDGDLEAIRKLNRAQRAALVQALVNGFSAESARRSPRQTPKPVIELPGK